MCAGAVTSYSGLRATLEHLNNRSLAQHMPLVVFQTITWNIVCCVGDAILVLFL